MPKRLDESELLRLIVENSRDFMTLFNAKGVVLFDSPAVRRALGVKARRGREFCRGESPILESDRAQLRQRFDQLVANCGIDAFETSWLLPNGETLDLEARMTAIAGEDGRTEMVLIVSNDISRRKQIERERDEAIERLSRIEELHNSVMGNVHDLITIFDKSGRPLSSSNSHLHLLGQFGLRADRNINSLDSFLHPDDRKRVQQGFGQLVQQGGFAEIEYRLELPGGETRWLEARADAIAGPDGKTERVVGVARDVTERKKAEAKLAESEQLYRLLADHSSDFIQLYSASGERLYQSPSMTRAGFAPDRAIGGEPVHPDDVATTRKMIESVLRDKVSQRYMFRANLPSGERSFEALASPILAADGSLSNAVVVSRDVTERMHAETELARTETLYRTLTENSNDLIALLGKDGRYLYFSPSFEKYFDGVPEAIGTLTHPEDRLRVRAELAQVIQTGSPTRTAYRVIRADGEITWLETNAVPIKDSTGQVEAVSIVARDITERVHSAERLANSERLFRAVTENLAEVIVVFDRNRERIYESPTIRNIRMSLNLDPDVEVGSHLSSADARSLRLAVHQTFVSAEQQTIDVTMRARDGQVHEISGKTYPILDENKAVDMVVVVAGDVTETREARRKVEESESRYRLLADNAEDFIQLIDPEGTVVFDSPAVVRILGSRYRPRANYLAPVHRDDRALVVAAFTNTIRTGEPHRVEFRMFRAANDIRWLEAICKLVSHDESANPLVLAVSRDITERKSAESVARQAQALEAVGKLTGSLAHDFNNLLGVLIGNLDIAEEQIDAAAPARRRLTIARDAALKAATVTNSLLSVARRKPMEITETDLNELVTEMLPLISTSVGRAITVKSDLCTGALKVRVDSSGFSNVVLNLAINARDAMADHQAAAPVLEIGTSQRHLSATDGLAGGSYAVVWVADNGIGMSPEIVAQAFEPFFTTKQRDKGTGLGLAMVYGFAKQLGGTARIESEPGKGTVVSVFLPLITSKEPQTSKQPNN